MVGKEIVENVAKDFGFLKNRVLAVLIFGSAVKDENPRDVDVCIVAPEGLDVKDIFAHLNAEKYDIWLFEELPLYMKMEVIENHEIVFCKDILELYEYFYRFRKLWKDQERRNRVTKEELKRMLRKR